MEIKEVGEFGLIERIKTKLAFPHQDIIKGIGDDACAIEIQKGRLLLSTSDSLIEDVHFDLRFISAYNLGKKSLAVNISDIAAMGGTPKFFLVSLAIPPKISVEFIDEFADGIKETANSFQTHVVGGDTSFSPEKLNINITLLGEAFPGNVIYRDNAHVGDQVFVTGTLGDSALGFEILMNRKELSRIEERFKDLVERHCNPTPRVAEGRLIAENRIASAMIDISDGLISDLGHICEQSKVGAKIWLEKLPASEAFQKVSREFTDRPIDLALGGGEDYELLFTVDKGNINLFNRMKNRFKTKVTHIGEIVEPEEGITVLDDSGKRYTVEKKGFDHFL
ncbi:MAG: thiamine-phosphate kinase [Thermodesulfobacteriota bacterium]